MRINNRFQFFDHSKITDYKIDAYGVKQYERIQIDQKTLLVDIENVDKKIAELLKQSGIVIVSDLLESDMDNLLSIDGINDEKLDLVYESVQNFVEREIEIEEEVDLSEIGIGFDEKDLQKKNIDDTDVSNHEALKEEE